ncbi:MAG TPA: winged helix-turn-helix domain-containing protein, partial [bacterium]|nr:winged helix-turn-helix domain-containing protein [bacterium]
EYGILKALIVQAGKVLTHGHLLAAVWGPGYQNQRHLLQVNVSNLRRKLEADPTAHATSLRSPAWATD